MSGLDLLVGVGRFIDRTTARLSAEFIIALLLIGGFLAAFFLAGEGDGEMRGALIAGFAGAWGFYLGRMKSSKDDRDQLSDSIATSRAAVRALSQQNTERGVATPLQGD